ncbi:MAG: M55 family metallopeptidase [Candidatus Aminicenantales bacterium]
MKRVFMFGFVLLVISALAFGLGQKGKSGQGLKVFISVDMEGISGIVTSEECSRAAGDDYGYFRKIMTQEANAAVEGALAAGAAEIWVRDSHGSARNILPDLLHKQAKLLRDWSGGPKIMMDGIDGTFDAVVLIGYHAKAGTPDAIIEHTMSGVVTDVTINGVSLPEAGINALIAGCYNVPVAFVAGDKAICDQAKNLFGEVETVAVKEGIGAAALCLHPEVAQEKIRAGVERALRNLSQFKPYTMAPPYTMVLKLKDEKQIYNGQFYPGVQRTGDWELTYESNDLMEVIKAFSYTRR